MSRRISWSQDALGKRVDNSAERLAVWVLNIKQKALSLQPKVIKVPGSNNMNLAAQAGLFTVLEQEGARGAPFEGETSDLYLARAAVPASTTESHVAAYGSSCSIETLHVIWSHGATLFPNYAAATRATET